MSSRLYEHVSLHIHDFELQFGLLKGQFTDLIAHKRACLLDFQDFQECIQRQLNSRLSLLTLPRRRGKLWEVCSKSAKGTLIHLGELEDTPLYALTCSPRSIYRPLSQRPPPSKRKQILTVLTGIYEQLHLRFTSYSSQILLYYLFTRPGLEFLSIFEWLQICIGESLDNTFFQDPSVLVQNVPRVSKMVRLQPHSRISRMSQRPSSNHRYSKFGRFSHMKSRPGSDLEVLKSTGHFPSLFLSGRKQLDTSNIFQPSPEKTPWNLLQMPKYDPQSRSLKCIQQLDAMRSQVKQCLDISRHLDTSVSFLPVGRVYADKICQISDIQSVSPRSPKLNPLATEEPTPRTALKEVDPNVRRREATGTFIEEIQNILTDIIGPKRYFNKNV